MCLAPPLSPSLSPTPWAVLKNGCSCRWKWAQRVLPNDMTSLDSSSPCHCPPLPLPTSFKSLIPLPTHAHLASRQGRRAQLVLVSQDLFVAPPPFLIPLYSLRPWHFSWQPNLILTTLRRLDAATLRRWKSLEKSLIILGIRFLQRHAKTSRSRGSC